MISSLVPPDDDNVFSRRTSGEQAALYIRRLIFDGALRPGSRVPQDEIAETLGISRIPLRESLIMLEREGWLDIEIHRGAFVSALDAESVADHFEMLGSLYVFAIERVVENWDESVIVRLEQLEAELEQARSAADAGRALFGLYVALVDAAKSERLKVNLRAISSLVPGDFFSAVPDAVGFERRSWGRIIRALRLKDAGAASDEFLSMMREVSQCVQQIFEDRGLFEAAGR